MQELFHVISRVGIPKVILTDQGTNFMSRTLRELYGLLNIKAIHVTQPQAAWCFNRTLKSMIRKSIHQDALNQHQWLDPCCLQFGKCPRLLQIFPHLSIYMGAVQAQRRPVPVPGPTPPTPPGCWRKRNRPLSLWEV